MSFRLEPDGIDRGIDFRHADHLRDHFTQAIVRAEVDRLEPHLLRVAQAVFVEIANHDHRGAQANELESGLATQTAAGPGDDADLLVEQTLPEDPRTPSW